MLLAGFDFIIKHRSGISNPADAPSRKPDYFKKNHQINDLLSTLQDKSINIKRITAEIVAGTLEIGIS